MDESRFDQIARAVSTSGTRRRLLGSLAGLGLGGALAALDAEAEKPKDRLSRRTKQHRRKRRNEKRRNANQNQGGNSHGSGGFGSDQCGATGTICSQDGDCCTNNCFNFQCADRVLQCSAGGATTPCRPPAKGCFGSECCNANFSCNDGCCSTDATQCNAEGNCCVPNCAGRSCGPDGCGEGGTCGTCPQGTTCNEATGQCPQPGCDVCPTCRYTTIQAAVDDTTGPTTIHLCAGIYTEATYITRNVSLIGTGQGDGAGDTVLSWPEDGGVLVMNGEIDVTLRSLRVTDGVDNAVNFNSDGTLTMIDCTVTENNSPNGATAVQVSGTVNMTGCTISNNQITGSQIFGGGMSYDGPGTATLTNCVISGNSAIGTDSTRTWGGGIAAFGGGSLILDNTRVTGNTTNGAGGGIYAEGTVVTLRNGSVVSGNNPDNCNGC